MTTKKNSKGMTNEQLDAHTENMSDDMGETPLSELTVATKQEEAKLSEPRVAICLPLLEMDSEGIEVDQYEHVTINGYTTLVKRGERVEVTVPVYTQLRNKFPTI